MSKKDKLYNALHYIIESIEYIEEQTNCSYEDFVEDRVLTTSTIFYLERVADATIHIPEDVKSAFKTINWKQVKGFRNVLVHEYLEGYDYEIVWATIKNDIPLLKTAVLEIKKYKYKD